MDIIAHIPDAPFRSGATGKYKLLIKEVTPKFNGYEYLLVDADGKEYNSVAKEHYSSGELLRCIITFNVVNARFVVSSTAVCKKQDLATLIPEPPKPQPRPKPEVKTKEKAKISKKKADADPERKRLGDPKLKGVSGNYVLRVAAVEQTDEAYSYKVEDAKGRQYDVQSKHPYSVGTIVDCKMSVTNAPSGALRVSVSTIKKHIPKTNQPGHKHKRGNPLKNWHPGSSSHDWPSPGTGDRFQLIYTPMGNKR